MDTYDNVRHDIISVRRDLNNVLLTLTEIAEDSGASAEIVKDIREKVTELLEPRDEAFGNTMYNLAINNVLAVLDKYHARNR